MNISKELDKVVTGVTSSSSKKKVIKLRVGSLINQLKKHWYGKLLEKLKIINDKGMTLDDYIAEVESNI